MDAIADSKDTMIAMLHDLHHKFLDGNTRKFLIVEGDAKFFNTLQSLKQEYGEELKWVIPYPGDWHTLMNYQIVLMKVYFDAGLKEMAKAAGYPIHQIQRCSQFKRVHYFILEAWEAVYRCMLASFFNNSSESFNTTLKESIAKLLESTTSQSQADFCKAFNHKVADINKQLGNSFKQFYAFVHTMAARDRTWKFWMQFVFEDAMAYIGFYLAIRSGDWDTRMAYLKMMAPLYSAFDHTTYKKLIAQHLADILCMPPNLLLAFQQGAFVVSICGNVWHSVAIDEAHEMLINKGCKTSITRPSPDYISRMAQYLPYRTRAIENARKQLLIEQKGETNAIITSPFFANGDDCKLERNVSAMIEIIQNKSLFEINKENRGLINPFSGKKASYQQEHDLLQFRIIGEEEFQSRVSYFILKTPSVQAPNRRRRLQTFAEKGTRSRQITQLEKDKQLVLTAMKKKMQHSRKTGDPICTPEEQLVQLPLALCTNDGNPLTGQKSYTTKSLESRYKNASPPIFAMELPSGWVPECVLMDGMFLINTTPLGSHKTLKDYPDFLLKRHAIPHLKRGSTEIHILFDNPGHISNTPKQFEQRRRDSMAKIPLEHCCTELQESTKISHVKWRETS